MNEQLILNYLELHLFNTPVLRLTCAGECRMCLWWMWQQWQVWSAVQEWIPLRQAPEEVCVLRIATRCCSAVNQKVGAARVNL